MGSICGEELMHMKEMGSSEERIVVSVRLRPLNGKEIGRNDVIDWECIDDNTIIYRNNNATERTNYPNAYTFDRVFRCECPTKQVYDEAAKKVALSVVSGINASIFAYGQTSSGKTYTMSGITEFTVEDIYDYIQRHEEREFVLKFSAMEIYNESVRDLLSTDATPLRLLDDPERGTVVDRLTEETLRDLDHLKELLSVCEAQRQIGETSLNEASSRSHQILRLSIESSARAFLGKGHSSTLSASVSFVDLAGSERASQTLSAGTRLKEGCHINRSLLTLGTVIRKLSKGRNGHVPYRDSKLTRILHCSLGGNARTAIICTISPARSHVEQSRNTLSFASCAKEVSINAQVNVVMSDKALVKQLQRELARLEGELRSPGPTSATRESASLLREKDLKIEKLETEIKQLTQQLHLAQSRLEDLDDQASQWSEFSQPLRIRTRSIQDLIHLDRDDASQHWAEFNHRPRIRAPNTLSDDDLISESSGVADRHCLDIGFTRFNSSQYSNACSESNDDPDEPDLQLPEIPGDQFLCDGASPRFSSSNTKFVEADPEVIIQDGKVTQDNDENSEEICKEVQCIKVDESSANRKAESNTLSMGESEGMLPKTLTENGAPTDWAPSSSPQKEDDQLKKAQNTIESFVHPLPNEPSAWSSEANLSSSKSSKLTRSRSCRAGLMAGSSPPWFQKADQNETTPPNGHEKDFPGRPKDFEIKLAALNYSPSRPWFSRECSFTSDQSASTDESKVYNMGNPSTEDATSIHTCDSGLKEMSKLHQEKQEMDTQLTVCCSDESKVQSSETQSEEDNASVYSCISIEKEMARLLYGKQATDDQVQETEQMTDGSENIVKDVEETEQKTDESEKTVKDVGLEQVQETEQKTNGSEKTVKDVSLHPVHDTVESLPKWQLDFERLQREIIELWDTCYVSLVHRTYFFLLFKGDPSDSIYMEVERRRLSFLRDRMSRGPKDKLILDGVPYLSPSSSMKALRREREMLSKQMLKRLSEKERLELYSKWGIGLNTKQRRLQLVRLLWTDTNDMNHITESANLVVRLVGHLEPGQALKEMFGLSLSFVPQQMGRRSFSWSKGMTTFL